MLQTEDNESVHLQYGEGNVLNFPVKTLKYRYNNMLVFLLRSILSNVIIYFIFSWSYLSLIFFLKLVTALIKVYPLVLWQCGAFFVCFGVFFLWKHF